ncbi:MAG: hypothetical protein KDE58_43160, partial [Caldilineaceae bacterium]|nr:hypothetical protein [Caldilineaceae bacterium]
MDAIPTAELIVLCEKERKAYREFSLDNSPACAELFRRAFQQDEEAWFVIRALFMPLLMSWASVQSTLDQEDIIQDALTEFFRFAPNSSTLAADDRIGPVLTYLRSCVKSSLSKRYRKQRILEHSLDDPNIFLPDADDQVSGLELRQILQDRLDKLLYDETERLVFQLRLVEGIAPRKIFEQYRELFSNIEELRQIIQRIVRRLRADETLKSLHGIPSSQRRNLGIDASLKIELLNHTDSKENIDVNTLCQLNEAILLDYITGVASAEIQAQIEASPACQLAAKQLAEDILPLLPLLERINCPDGTALVAYQEKQLRGSEQLVIHRHIEHCAFCREELQLFEAIDQVPLAPQPGPLRRIIDAILQTPAASPTQLQPVVRGQILRYAAPQVIIQLSTRVESGKQRSWRLSGQLRRADGQLFTDAAQIVLCQLDRQEPVHRETVPKETGMFVFAEVEGGKYTLSVLTDEEEIVIRELMLGDDF